MQENINVDGEFDEDLIELKREYLARIKDIDTIKKNTNVAMIASLFSYLLIVVIILKMINIL